MQLVTHVMSPASDMYTSCTVGFKPDNLESRCLQWFDTVDWAAGRASGLWKLSGEVLEWLSVWSEVQMICIWSSWCHCHPLSLAPAKSRMVCLSGASLPGCPGKRLL